MARAKNAKAVVPKKVCRTNYRGRKRLTQKLKAAQIRHAFDGVKLQKDKNVFPLRTSSPKRNAAAPTADKPSFSHRLPVRHVANTDAASPTTSTRKLPEDHPKGAKRKQIDQLTVPILDTQSSNVADDESNTDGSIESDDDRSSSESDKESSPKQKNKKKAKPNEVSRAKGRTAVALSNNPDCVRHTGEELDCPFVLPLEKAKLNPPKSFAPRVKNFRMLEKHNIENAYIIPKNNAADGCFLMFHPQLCVTFSPQLMEYASKIASHEIDKAAAKWPLGRLSRFADARFKKLQEENGVEVPQSLVKPDGCRHDFPLLQPHVLKAAVALKHMMGTISVLYIRLAPVHSLFYAPLRLQKPSDGHLETVGQIMASQPPFFAELSRQAFIYLPTVVPDISLSEAEKKLAMCEAFYRMNETFAMRIKASNRLMRRSHDIQMAASTRKHTRGGTAVKDGASVIDAVAGNGKPMVASTPKRTRGGKAVKDGVQVIDAVVDNGKPVATSTGKRTRGGKAVIDGAPVIDAVAGNGTPMAASTPKPTRRGKAAQDAAPVIDAVVDNGKPMVASTPKRTRGGKAVKDGAQVIDAVVDNGKPMAASTPKPTRRGKAAQDAAPVIDAVAGNGTPMAASTPKPTRRGKAAQDAAPVIDAVAGNGTPMAASTPKPTRRGKAAQDAAPVIDAVAGNGTPMAASTPKRTRRGKVAKDAAAVIDAVVGIGTPMAASTPKPTRRGKAAQDAAPVIDAVAGIGTPMAASTPKPTRRGKAAQDAAPVIDAVAGNGTPQAKGPKGPVGSTYPIIERNGADGNVMVDGGDGDSVHSDENKGKTCQKPNGNGSSTSTNETTANASVPQNRVFDEIAPRAMETTASAYTTNAPQEDDSAANTTLHGETPYVESDADNSSIVSDED